MSRRLHTCKYCRKGSYSGLHYVVRKGFRRKEWFHAECFQKAWDISKKGDKSSSEVEE